MVLNDVWMARNGREGSYEMSYVRVEGLVKRFGEEVLAVDNISFVVERGKFVTLLGPSGCGKTTTLRCIAGLEDPDEGEIYIDGQCVSSPKRNIMVPPEDRHLGMVFQSYAVWPHMTVFSNVAYGLKAQGASKGDIKARVGEALELVGLVGLGNRYATKLSGGQQQRVALARALVYNPKVLLFDEPLSNLDAKLRERMRLELTNLVHKVGFTAVYVTHDQAEAMVMSDEIIVIDQGRIQQKGDARTIYMRPANRFVANFIGVANLLEGHFVAKSEEEGMCVVEVSDGVKSHRLFCSVHERLEPGEKITVSIRPETVSIVREAPEGGQENILEGRISTAIYLGSYVDCLVSLGSKELHIQGDYTASFEKDESVYLEVSPDNCLCLKG
jgi:iron(III) transport system ATP-binding protein